VDCRAIWGGGHGNSRAGKATRCWASMCLARFELGGNRHGMKRVYRDGRESCGKKPTKRIAGARGRGEKLVQKFDAVMPALIDVGSLTKQSIFN